MNIVYITREYPPSKRLGGIGSYTKEIAEYMVKLQHRVYVITAEDDTNKDVSYEENGVNIIRLRGGDFYIEKSILFIYKKLRIFYRFYSYRKRILHAINRIKNIDIIEVPEFGAEALYLQSLKHKVIIRLHTPSLFDRSTLRIKEKHYYNIKSLYDHWVGKKEFKILAIFPNIVSCSIYLRDWCNINVYSKPIHVIHNPINTEKWFINKNKKWAPNRILYVGTIAKEKGVEDLIKACNLLIEKGVDVTLSLIGKKGDYGNHLEKKYGNLLWCNFRGQINRNQLIDAYYSHGICVIPSWWDNLPITCLEAMSCGNIVIGSNCGGISEIIEDGIDGFLVKPKDPYILAQTINKVLALTQEEVSCIQKNSVRKIKTKFSCEIITKQMENFYKLVINEYKKSSLD